MSSGQTPSTGHQMPLAGQLTGSRRGMISSVNLARRTSSRWADCIYCCFHLFILYCCHILQVWCSVVCLVLRRTAARSHREKHERAHTHWTHAHTRTHAHTQTNTHKHTHTQGAIRLQRAIMHKAFEIMQDKAVQKFAHAGFTCSRFVAGRDNQV
jgi:hypothetical protein